jgi:hypothetical protein
MKNYFVLSTHNIYEKENFYNLKQYYDINDLNEIQRNLNLIHSNKGDGPMIGPVYVGKGSNIPRHKIKEFFREKNLKKTSIIEKSNTVVFDKQIIKQLIDKYKGTEEKIAIIPFTQRIFDHIKNYHSTVLKTIPKGNNWSITNHNDKLNEMTKFFNNDVNILIREENYNNYDLDFRKIVGDITFTKKIAINNYRTKNLTEVWDIIESYLTNPHNNIIWDDTLLESLNSDGLDMDDDYINILYSMFESNEQDNIKLALEMLLNVNLEKHSLTVVLLLNKYKSIFDLRSGNTGSQALKTLNLYFKNKGINWREDYRTFSSGLFNFYKNDEKSIKIIKKFFIDNLNSYLKRNEAFYIQLSDIDFSVINK